MLILLANDETNTEAVRGLRVVSERAQCKRERKRRQFLLHYSADAPVGIQLTCYMHTHTQTNQSRVKTLSIN